ncbi:MAG: NADP-dependent oxidoreductase, partial [Caulobacteraceae bacterium]
MAQQIEVVLARPVTTKPCAADFAVVERATPDAGDGEILVRVAYLSLDPYIGSRLRGKHMGEPSPAPGESLPGFAVGEVVSSRHPGFAIGDHVVGECGWTELGVMRGDQARRVNASLPLSAHLGALGMPGLTAWAGVTQLAKVSEGDIFLVDAAAGAVGGTAGQIARNLGARAIGIAGGAAKCDLVRDAYGFDACIDYKQSGWQDAARLACGGGPTVHFENVGLSVLQSVMPMLRDYGRVVLCGLAEHYQSEGPPASLAIGAIIGKRAQMLGLVVYDFYPRLDEWVALATPWV